MAKNLRVHLWVWIAEGCEMSLVWRGTEGSRGGSAKAPMDINGQLNGSPRVPAGGGSRNFESKQ